MQKVVDFNEPEICRGAIFRVKGSRPYEELVDFMSVETAEAARPLGMMVATGYSAGHTFLHLPLEALVSRDKAHFYRLAEGTLDAVGQPRVPGRG